MFMCNVQGGGGGVGFRLGRVLGPRLPGPGRLTASPSLSLSRLELLSFGGTVAGRRVGGARAVSVTHDCVTDSLPGAADTTITTKLNLSRYCQHQTSLETTYQIILLSLSSIRPV